MAGRPQREKWHGLGRFLDRALEARDWTQQQLADASGQSRATVSLAVARDEVTPGAAARIADALGLSLTDLRAAVESQARTGDRSLTRVVRETSPVWDRDASVNPLSADARAFILEFQAEAVRLGATDEDLEFVRRAMTAPENYVWHQGGHSRALSDAQAMKQLRALAEGLRAWLQTRQELRRETGGGATE